MDHRVVIGVLVGAALGTSIAQGLHAQAMPPAIAIIDVSGVTDPEGFKAVTQTPDGVTAAVMLGGRYVARTDKITVLSGAAPKRFVIIAFDNLE